MTNAETRVVVTGSILCLARCELAEGMGQCYEVSTPAENRLSGTLERAPGNPACDSPAEDSSEVMASQEEDSGVATNL